jgi:hypothetical protein
LSDFWAGRKIKGCRRDVVIVTPVRDWRSPVKSGERDAEEKRVFRAGGVVQVVQHLPSKYEALSSNSILKKKKKAKEDPLSSAPSMKGWR